MWSEQNLPAPVYSAMYRSSFRVYRFGLESGYSRNRRKRQRAKDWEGVRRADAVIKALPYSMVGPSGLEASYSAVRDVLRRGVPGAVVECGVAQGGSSAVMALALRDAGDVRHMWLFDSYEGLPAPTDDDFDATTGATGIHIRPLPKGSCLGTYEEVHELMSEVLGVPQGSFTQIKGWFQDTVAAAAPSIGAIAVLRLDGDWYESTKVCLDALFPQLSRGGSLIVDDYHSCYGSKRAVHEYLADQGDTAPAFTDDGSGGVVYTKL